MRILFITPGFPADAHDTTCIPPLQALVRALLLRDVDVQVIALEYPFRATPYMWPGASKGGTAASVYPCNGRNRRWLRWRTHAWAWTYATQIFSEKPYDAIHSFWLGPAWVLGEQIAARRQALHWTTLMGQDVLPRNRYLRRLQPEGAARLVALTPFHNDQLEQSCGLRAGHCIPWGLEDEDLLPGLPQRAVQEGPPRERPPHEGPPLGRPLRVLGVGSLLPVKDWVRWLRVVRLAIEQRPSLHAELIGSGPEERRLKALVRQFDLEAHILFTPTIPRPQVLERMRESRVLLHTARFESFGYVLAEAAAQGCHVVSTPVGTAPEVAVCADSDEGLAQALLDTLDVAPSLSSGISRIAETAERYLQLYAL